MTATDNNPSSETSRRSRHSNFLLSEGVLLAIASSGFYLLTFVYERGYIEYFNVPPHFINISLVNVFLFGIVASALLSVAHPALDFLIKMVLILLPIIPKAYLFSVKFLMRGAFVSILFAAVVGISRWSIWIMPLVAVCVALIVIEFLPALFAVVFQRSAGGVTQKLLAQEEASEKASEKVRVLTSEIELYNVIYRWAGIDAIALTLIAILAILLALLAGFVEAVYKTRFLVTNTTPEVVVLRAYGDSLICATFDRAKKEVHNSFTILKSGEDPKLTLTLEEIGPLTPAEVKPLPIATPIPPAAAPSVQPTSSNAPVSTPEHEPKPTVKATSEKGP